MSVVLTNPAFLTFLFVIAVVFGVGIVGLLIFNGYFSNSGNGGGG